MVPTVMHRLTATRWLDTPVAISRRTRARVTVNVFDDADSLDRAY